ncbi:AaceriABR201Wp [[Ashbya] aceris (nom. inval.)]|nr:AaceriABR201Wp [[Ashbya] aceris (nom. inval.)]
MLSTTIPQFPDTKLYISSFGNVSNAPEVLDKLAELPYSIIDARTLLSREQLLSAIYRALLEKQYNRLRTRNIHTEVLLCLSPTSNVMSQIGDAMKRFGIKKDTTNVVLVKAVTGDEAFDPEEFSKVIRGEEQQFSDAALHKSADIDTIRENYKLKCFQYERLEELSAALVHAIQLRGL